MKLSAESQKAHEGGVGKQGGRAACHAETTGMHLLLWRSERPEGVM